MLSHSGEAVTFDAWYSANKTGKTGLTVLVDIYDPTGTRIVTGAAASEVGGGFYSYQLVAGLITLAGNYRALFRTTDGSVDQQHIPALWIARQPWVEQATADPLQNLLTAYNTAGTIGYDLVHLTSGPVSFLGPVLASGTALQFVAGQALQDEHGTAAVWTQGGSPDLTGSTVTLEIGWPSGYAANNPLATWPCTHSGDGTSVQMITLNDVSSAATAALGALPGVIGATLQGVLWATWPDDGDRVPVRIFPVQVQRAP